VPDQVAGRGPSRSFADSPAVRHGRTWYLIAGPFGNARPAPDLARKVRGRLASVRLGNALVPARSASSCGQATEHPRRDRPVGVILILEDMVM
jgi:hypothetical protein